MHLIYLDESGNTGCNPGDSQQPVFVLCALVVPEHCWQALEADLHRAMGDHWPGHLPSNLEIHGTELRNGRGQFAGQSLERRLAIRDAWLRLAVKHDLRLMYRGIDKARFRGWIESEFGPGVSINPHVAAFPFLAMMVDEYLAKLPDQPLGTFISDENIEVARDVENSLRFLRGTTGALRLNQIVEKGFFISSQRSLPLQLCDLCAVDGKEVGRVEPDTTAQAH